MGVEIRDNGTASIPQILIRNTSLRTTVVNNAISRSSGIGVQVLADPVDTVVSNNQYSITTPESFAATVNAALSTPYFKAVRLNDTGGETYTIAAGTVTQIAGTTLDGVSPAIGDRILISCAPAATGTGSFASNQPTNGIYTVTGNTTNLTLARASDMSGSETPIGTMVYIRDGNGSGGWLVSCSSPASGAFTWGATANQWSYNYATFGYIRNGAFSMANKTLTNPTINNYTEGVVANGTVTTTKTLDLTNGTVQTATLTASTACTFTMPTVVAGKSFTLYLKQPAVTGNGTATFTGVKWPPTGAPTITATAGRMDALSFFSDGANWYGSYVQGYTY